MGSNFPSIDLVYTWVNGDDPAHQRLSRQYAQKKLDLNPERTRDIYTLLKYSLRSVAQFAPWLRNIYLITCRPQAPDWLDCTHPQIKIVHHDEIFDNSSYLPTFNCNCIESYLHRAPGLSDYFLYLNDDYLFGNPVTPGDFIATQENFVPSSFWRMWYRIFLRNDKTEDGTMLVYGTLWGERIPFIYENRFNDLVSRFQHHPLLVYKPAYAAMLQTWPDAVHRTRSHRFRTRQDLMMHGLYRYYLLTRLPHRARPVPLFRYRNYYCFHKITNHYTKQGKGLARLKTLRPKFYCLNDDQRDQPNQAVVQLVKTFLDEYYPHPSPYERKTA